MAHARRTWLAAAAGSLLLVAGCGFALRRPAELPFRRIAIAGFKPQSPMAAALRQALPRTVTVVESPQGSDVVLLALDDRVDKTVAASTAAGQVREFRLRVSLRFRLDHPDGTPQLAEQTLELTRDMSYSETAALAKQAEEAVLLREMRADLAQQLLHMLAASGRANGHGAAAPASAPAAP